jgi:hypothetical protein
MFEKEISASQIIISILPEEPLQATRLEIFKSLIANSKNFCCISFSKPYTTLMAEFKSCGIDTAFIIDTLTTSVHQPPKVADCIFIQSPSSLTDISVAVSKVMAEKPQVNLVLDSLSSLLLYENQYTLIKFLHNLINKVRLANSKLVVLVLRKDAECKLLKDLEMFVDSVIDTTR